MRRRWSSGVGILFALAIGCRAPEASPPVLPPVSSAPSDDTEASRPESAEPPLEPLRVLQPYHEVHRRLDLSPDGRFLLAQTYGQLSLWDVEGARVVATYYDVMRASFDAGGEHLVVIDDQRRGRVHELRTGAIVREFRVPGSSTFIVSEATREDRHQALFLEGPYWGVQTPVLFELTSDAPVRSFQEHRGRSYGSDFSRDGERLLLRMEGTYDVEGSYVDAKRTEPTPPRRKLAVLVDTNSAASLARFLDDELFTSFSADQTRLIVRRPTRVEVVDAETGSVLLEGDHGAPVHDVIASEDGACVVTRGDKGGLKVWSVERGPGAQLEVRGAHSVVLAPDCRRVATFGARTRIWDAADGHELEAVELATSNWRRTNAYASGRKGSTLVVGGESGGVAFIDWGTGAATMAPPEGRAALFSVEVDDAGRRAVSASIDGTVSLWDVTEARKIADLEAPPRAVSDVAFLPGSSHVLLGEARSGFTQDGRSFDHGWSGLTATTWDANTGTKVASLAGNYPGEVKLRRELTSGVVAVHSARDRDGATLWNVRRGEASWIPAKVEASSPDGTLAAWVDGTRVVVREVATGRDLTTIELELPRRVRAAVAFVPGGDALLVSHDGEPPGLWDPRTGEHRRTLSRPPRPRLRWKYAMPKRGEAQPIAFSPDGRRVAVGGTDRAVRVWELESGDFVGAVPGLSGRVWSVEWAGNDRVLCRADGKRGPSVRLLDLASRTIVPGFGDRLGRVPIALSGRGNRMALARRPIEIWDTAEARKVSEIQYTVTKSTPSVSLNSDGTLLLTRDESVVDDYEVRLFRTDTREYLGGLPAPPGDVNDAFFLSRLPSALVGADRRDFVLIVGDGMTLVEVEPTGSAVAVVRLDALTPDPTRPEALVPFVSTASRFAGPASALERVVYRVGPELTAVRPAADLAQDMLHEGLLDDFWSGRLSRGS